MKKTYQVYARTTQGSGADYAEQEFNFDWGIIPEGEYEMTFSFISVAKKISEALGVIESVATNVAFIVPFMTDRYDVNKTSGYAGSSNIGGFINFYDGNITSGHHMRQYRAVVSDNAAVIVRGKPSGNKFIVKCTQEGGTLGVMFPYTLVITFKSLC